ncbi:hypothetical protein LTR62_007881 [Meristemomyces frigidus]|uniref:Amidohydrolase-related domain-containing protein n=1 Tax=Meristemomyces frigidus TaxID=1508187 RepID=A0AAN7TBF4_9PEZI|nr:hypothetical protein LTR62_007881 [Meristemomyces frigidus]
MSTLHPYEKDALPPYSSIDRHASVRQHRRHRKRALKIIVLLFFGYTVYQHVWPQGHREIPAPGYRQSIDGGFLSTARLQSDYEQCSRLRTVPQDPAGPRDYNARYVPGQKATLIRNATVWTGEPMLGSSAEDERSGQGYSWTRADVLLENGLIKQVGPQLDSFDLPSDVQIYNARGRMLTAGIIDMHSHAGDNPLPDLRGGSDDNELSNDITPYVRSIDGINILDPQIMKIKSGGVTTSLILPGSGNNIGGEAFVIKHAVGKADGRPELSVESMLADPDKNWRYMKMACGENAKRVYGRVGRDFGPFSRLGEAWYFRHAFEQASTLVKAQDDWCAVADERKSNNWMGMNSYLPQDLQWESLAAVLRGQVHVNTHCYTTADLEAFVRHTNEFKFPVRAFHHAHQTYLVPEVLKRAYGNHTPAAALFADNMYYKVEAYTASEQAGKILYENGITPVYVSDNPVLNAQHVLFEAAKAYRYGLPYHVALAGVTSASAGLLGLGERIGKVKTDFDADLVVWDSDPLSVGAAPAQVWIDGVAQFEDPFELKKPARGPIKHDLALRDVAEVEEKLTNVIFTGVTAVLLPKQISGSLSIQSPGTAVVRDGRLTCVGGCEDEVQMANNDGFAVISLRDGHISPPYTAFGSFLGLVEITAEEDTQDGYNTEETFSAAVNGLMFRTKNLAAAYRHGVTHAISAPAYKDGGHKGVSACFATGAGHKLEKGAVCGDGIALHYTLTLAAKGGKTPSISTVIEALKAKLISATKAADNNTDPEELALRGVVNGSLPLVITVHSADTIASLLALKADLDATTASHLRLIIYGGAESHLLASELALANVSVILAPLQPYAQTWDQRGSLPGAPLTNGTAIDILHAAGVKLGISVTEDWETRDLDLMAGIAHANSGGRISEKEAVGMVSRNIYEILGMEGEDGGFLVYEGHPLGIGGRVKAVADGRGGVSVWI